MSRIRFGLIGAGGIAQAHLQAFLGSAHAELAGVADIRTDGAAALAERAGCRAYPSHEALTAAERLDAVVIATPPSTHPGIAEWFLSRGLHVLCEKPLSVNVAGARRMMRAAAGSGALLTMGSKFRFSDDVVQARSLIASGLLGDVSRFENVFTSVVDMGPRWNSRPEISGGGVMIDNGTHSADLMRYVVGPIAAVSATAALRMQELQVEDTVHVQARSVNGILGTFDLSWSVNSGSAEFMRVWGSQGTLFVGWAESRYRTATSSDWVKFGRGYDKVRGLLHQLDNFCQAIRGEEPLLITSEDALASVEVVQACYRSLELGAWVDVAGRTERRAAPRAVPAPLRQVR